MALQWRVTLWIAKMAWIGLKGWLTSCFLVAEDLASAFRNAPLSLHPPSSLSSNFTAFPLLNDRL